MLRGHKSTHANKKPTTYTLLQKYCHSLASHSAPIPMDASHLPILVAHLNVPEGTLLPVEAVPGTLLLDKLPSLGIFYSCPLPEPLPFAFPAFNLASCPSLREGTRVPRSNPETVHALWTCARPWFARLELSQVGTGSASKKRRD